MPGKWIFPLFILFFLGLSLSATAADYTFSIVPQFNSRKLFTVWNPILIELGKQTGDTYKFFGTPNIPAFEKNLFAGTFDFAYCNPYQMFIANRDQGYIPLVRDHSKMLTGILVVRNDDPIKDIKELEGKRIAFPAPNALGASLLMRAELKRMQGINIKPVYVKTHNSVYLNVKNGLVAAGGGVDRTLNEQTAEVKDALRKFYTTQGVTPHAICVHPRVPQDVRDKVKAALLGMSALLKKVPIEQVGEATVEDYVMLGELGLDEFYIAE